MSVSASASLQNDIDTDTSTSQSNEFESQRQNPSAYDDKNTSLVWHHSQAFACLHFAQYRMGLKLAANGLGQCTDIILSSLQKIHQPIQWTGNLRRQARRPLSLRESSYQTGPQNIVSDPLSLAHSDCRGTSILQPGPSQRGNYYPLQFGRRGTVL